MVAIRSAALGTPGIMVRGECSTCGQLYSYEDDGATLFLTVSGRGMYAGTVYQAELRCINAQECSARHSGNG